MNLNLKRIAAAAACPSRADPVSVAYFTTAAHKNNKDAPCRGCNAVGWESRRQGPRSRRERERESACTPSTRRFTTCLIPDPSHPSTARPYRGTGCVCRKRRHRSAHLGAWRGPVQPLPRPHLFSRLPRVVPSPLLPSKVSPRGALGWAQNGSSVPPPRPARLSPFRTTAGAQSETEEGVGGGCKAICYGVVIVKSIACPGVKKDRVTCNEDPGCRSKSDMT